MAEEPVISEDYGSAVVQVVCLLYERAYHLVFASTELLPREIPRPPEEPVSSIAVKRMGVKARLFHRRYIVEASKALEWYQNCRAGTFSLLGDDSSNPIFHGSLLEEPAWPQLIVGDAFPVWGDISSTSRAHHLYPAKPPPLLARLFEAEPESERWISDRVFASFARYPELAGSVHLLVPNPVFRSMTVRLRRSEDGREGTSVEITPRSGYTSKGLEVVAIDHRPSGISSYQRVPFGDDPFLLVQHGSVAEEVEYMVHCPRRGVLEWQKPTGFLRQMNVSGSLVDAKKRIVVPAEAGKVNSETFELPVFSQGRTQVLKAKDLPNEIPARLRSSQSDRRRADEAERLGQKWFHRSRAEATEYIRELIGQARSRVWIVDPYFATMELFSFALATTYSDVEVIVLTGAETAMMGPDSTDRGRSGGEVLHENLSAHKEMDHIKVLVMTGEKPTVHDRFLVIDDKVWFTGNSLNTIGIRAGMMISVPAPEVVIENLKMIIRDEVRTKPLTDWVKQRELASGAK